MVKINYQKRKNQKLFKSLENPENLFLSQTQNYIPIYNRFFNLNEKNFNSINLNHQWHLIDLKNKIDENVYECFLENSEEDENKNKKVVKEVFFKLAPLLDPFKYLIGKYDLKDDKLFHLPNLQSNEENTMNKIINVNNAAYIDSFFLYLNSFLIYKYEFLHGVDYYGSFLSIKNNYQINVFDDLEYLIQSDFFIKNKNVLFSIDNYDHLMEDDSVHSENKKKKITIEKNDLETSTDFVLESLEPLDIIDDNGFISEYSTLDNKENMMELECNDLFSSIKNEKDDANMTTLKSHSSCSSRTSHTESEMEELEELEEDDEDLCNSEDTIEDNENRNHLDFVEDDNEEDDDDDNYETVSEDEEDQDEDEEFIEEKINVSFPHFPVEVICMENCTSTLDELIINDELNEEQWFACLMQVIMILITFQKVFSFTHNDLHTNNIMYIETEKKYIYYCYEGIYYKVPTFGRIFKIIDFGRSIYHFNGNIFCSDSFEDGGDAATQYNTEPYFNEKKPRIEPNYSFDLCRLACSIFDYVVEDFQKIKNLESCSEITKLIVEWCLDDKGINVLYKNNGEERYPDFKLYKMIARCVHHHTPEAQLKRDMFKKFIISKSNISSKQAVLNIDSFASLS